MGRIPQADCLANVRGEHVASEHHAEVIGGLPTNTWWARVRGWPASPAWAWVGGAPWHNDVWMNWWCIESVHSLCVIWRINLWCFESMALYDVLNLPLYDESIYGWVKLLWRGRNRHWYFLFLLGFFLFLRKWASLMGGQPIVKCCGYHCRLFIVRSKSDSENWFWIWSDW